MRPAIDNVSCTMSLIVVYENVTFSGRERILILFCLDFKSSEFATAHTSIMLQHAVDGVDGVQDVAMVTRMVVVAQGMTKTGVLPFDELRQLAELENWTPKTTTTTTTVKIFYCSC